jgi:hypothetical protein
VVALARTDRRKDRVEVGYEELAAAEERASALTAATGVETRIIGWVHSHPHITVLPSHVDLRTQAQYQQMVRLLHEIACTMTRKGRGRGGLISILDVVVLQPHRTPASWASSWRSSRTTPKTRYVHAFL